MMMIVLDDSRVQVSRAEILNQLSRVIAISDEFQPIAELTLQELMGSTKAKAAWFRTLENGRLRLTASRGLPDAFMTNVGEIDISGTVTEELLRVGEVGVVPLEAAQPQSRQQHLKNLGVNHILIIPVLGKSSPIGVYFVSNTLCPYAS